ncbi:MAG: methylamine utilization protein MauG [Hyphomicrobiales bacterium]|nr:methylamine utilization protein MauG [Hyphomicrobiales bacterium]
MSSNDFIVFDQKQAQLGQLLFYDKILSGNQNISCGSCHHQKLGGSDGLSLGIGEGGIGLGKQRTAGIKDDRIQKRIPRNAPALWNLGAKEIKLLFHDGRLSKSDFYENGFNSPAEEWLPKGLSNLVAAQALLPLTSQFEMAGNPRENQVAGAAFDRIDKVWPILAKRVRIIPEYGELFVDAFAHISKPEQVSIVEIGEALAAFIGTEWFSIDSPFDAYLAGDKQALSTSQMAGLDLFYGQANCAKCHSGSLLSDQNFYALAIPPFGPGRTRRFDPYARDVGRMGASDRLEDAYRFRTPSLRNVVLTAPYGHNGAYPTLEGIIKHHLTPQLMFDNWTQNLAELPPISWLKKADFLVQADSREMARVRNKIDIVPVALTAKQVTNLVDFMASLTGNQAYNLPLGVPDSVPSGLEIDR